MEAKKKVSTTTDQATVKDLESSVPLDGYVSPEILAAEAGEQADFSMHLAPPDEVPENDEEPDPDA
jgi:hypothetical protein